ncbi:ankyrin repeat domain-containing protein [Modicisalibacter luteus]|uniref:Ankyrin repeat domain-containing protein n=1 Tax=Modicisalibacter luteus TaxID=453962 RepID=A0ABV7M5F0_9GAMM|nr:ankyrin repeat domain-containing protein [Halomonas lutea]GHB07904.1 UNC-44 ankyrin [Halomonas lutea]
MSALLEAVREGRWADVKAALSEDDSIDCEELSATAFTLALESGFKNVAIELLADPRFDPNARDTEPLRLAVRLGYLDTASILLEKGANPNFRCKESSSALLLALEYEYFDLAQQMVAKGAELNIRNSKGWTPLIWATIKGYRRIVEFLLENGADIHICNNDGWNALTGAYFKQRTDIVELLIERGAHFGRKYSEAALLSAYEQGYDDTVRKLVSEGCNVNIMDADGTPLLILAIRRGDLAAVKLFLEHGADANCRSDKGNSALSVALDVREEIAELLIEHGASPNIPNQKGWWPLHTAADRGNAELCKHLMDRGANPDQRINGSSTPLILAAGEGHLKVVELLVESGANLNLKNPKGFTAHKLAELLKHHSVRNLLENKGCVTT